MQILPPDQGQPGSYYAPTMEVTGPGASTLRASIRGPARLGLAAVVLIVAGFGGWAATAPLAGGAVAPGVISPDGSRKTVQHLEGGIIGEILVRDGDAVATGAHLLVLEETQARARYEMQLGQDRALQAMRARLTAEQLGDRDISFPDELIVAAGEREVRDILAVQRQLFATRSSAHAARKRVLMQRIRQIREQIHGLEAQLESSSQRLAIVEDELAGKEKLLRKGLMPKPHVLAVRRARAEVEGDRGEYRASIARAEQQIGEAQLELVKLDAERADEIATELDKVRGELVQSGEQLGTLRDTLRRTVVTAPVDGTIVNLRFKTRGGVIRAGDPILDIVPAGDDLLIDARVAPTDIDVVHVGLPAQVHLSAYSQRSLPRITGRVRSVSADSLQDQRGVSYYLARVEVDRDELARLAAGVQLVPGMPAEVLIVTSERTLFGYLLQPFRDIFRRSLREV